MNHSDALSKLIKTRYFIEFGKRKKVMALWSETEANKARSKGVQPNEKEQLQDLLFSMYFIETHLDKVDVTTLDTYKQIFEDKFNEIFPLI